MENLLINNDGGICTVTINRPKALNALNVSVISELNSFFDDAAENEDIKAIIVTGAGEKSFVAGADISNMAKAAPTEAVDFSRMGQKLVRKMETLKKPIIAAVNGFCLGGGMELALACDFIYASDNAKLGLPEVTLGIFPGWGGTQNMPKQIGTARAKEMIFTGKMIDAQTAYDWGLVNLVTSQEMLISEATKTAGKIMANGLIAVGQSKESVDRGAAMSKEDAYAFESSLFAALFATDDQKEGMSAFLEKRKPEFKNR